MEVILGFLAGVMFNWWFGALILVFAMVSSNDESAGFTIFWTALLAFVIYHTVDMPVEYFWLALAAYVPIGVVWSVYRWKRYAIRRVEKYNEIINPSDSDYARLLRNTDSKQNVDTIVAWMIVWPISIIENMTSDIVAALNDFVKNKMNGVYKKLSDSALESAKTKYDS